MTTSSVDIVIGNIDKACEIYIRITSMLIEYGYEYIREHVERAQDITGIEEILNTIDLLEEFMSKGSCSKPDHILRIATSQTSILSSTESLQKNKQETPEKLVNVYRDILSRSQPTEEIEYFEPSRFTPQRNNTVCARSPAKATGTKPKTATTMQMPKKNPMCDFDPRKRIATLRFKKVLQNSIMQKVEEKLVEMMTNQQEQQQQAEENQPNPNQSINVEDLDLQI